MKENLMPFKSKIGPQIRQKREAKQLSREKLCHDGSRLTVRQLIRIEKGQSLPSLDKLDYIAQQLGLKPSDLLAEEELTIPDTYFELKHRLVKFPTYGDPERVGQKQAMIEEAYEKYFTVLPEEELLFLDLSEKILNWSQTKKLVAIEEIYEDAFEQLQEKKIYNLNDLMVLGYYLIGIQQQKYYDKKLFNKLKNRLLEQEPSTDELYNIDLLSILISVLGVYVQHGDYGATLPVLKKVYQLIEETQQPSYRPSVMMVEAKYYLNVEGDKEQAGQLYDQAINFATLLGDQVLADGLREEKDRDNLA